MAAVRELLVEFTTKVDTSGLLDTSKKVQGLIGKLKGLLRVLGAVTGAAAIGFFIKSQVKAAAAAGDLADQVGLTTESFQALQVMAKIGGASVEDIRITLKSLAKNALLVTQGSKTMVRAFDELGVTVTDANGKLKSNDVLLLDVGAALSALENPTDRVARAQTVLGEASLKLLPALKGTREELQANLDELKALGGFSEEAIENARKFQAAFLRMQFVLQGVAGTLITLITPAFKALTVVVTKTAKFFQELFRDTKFLRNIFAGGLFVAIKRLLPTLIRIGKMFGFFGLKKGLVGLRRLFPILGKIGRAFGFAGKLLRKFILPFLVFDEIFTFFEGGDTLIGRFIDQIAGPGTAKKFQDAIANFTQGIKSFLTFFFTSDPTARANAEAEMKAAFSKAGELFADFAGTLGAAIITWLVETGALFGEAWDFMIADLSEMFSGLWEDLKKTFSEAWSFMIADVTALINTWIETISEVLILAFDTIWSGFKDAAVAAFNKVASIGAKTLSGLLDFIPGFGDGDGAGGRPATLGGAGGGAGGGGNVTQNNAVTQNITSAPGQSLSAVGVQAASGARRGTNANLQNLRGLTQN